MKCPKCGYLGFETTERCRNCQYDFSLAPFASEPDLALNTPDRRASPDVDVELPTVTRPDDAEPGDTLDLDRLFGAEESASGAAAIQPKPQPADDPAKPDEPEGAPPFDDTTPLVPPPAARAPLAVRRATPEVPRNRPRTTRPLRSESSLALEPEKPSSPEPVGRLATETVAATLETPSLAARVSAGLIDLLLLGGIDLVVLYLTLRITGLSNSYEDVRVLPVIPFVGFLALVGFGYVAAFTVAGGQTIGKMIMSLRVIGDDGRPIDMTGGMLRAMGCMLVPVTLGLSYVPVLVTSDHRALHDRLAGTRVVRE
jgi:uncharacterized RDD family membrane protein YckC